MSLLNRFGFMALKSPVQQLLRDGCSHERFNTTVREVILLTNGWNSNYDEAYAKTLSFKVADVYTFRNYLCYLVRFSGAPYPVLGYDIDSEFTERREDGFMTAHWLLGHKYVCIEAHRGHTPYMFFGVWDNVLCGESVVRGYVFRSFEKKNMNHIEGRLSVYFNQTTGLKMRELVEEAKKAERLYDYKKSLRNLLKGIRGEFHE